MQGKSKFIFTFEYNKRDLQFLLKAIYKCYLEILVNENVISHKENDIRDLFISDKYLDDFRFKEVLNIIEFKFDKEISTLTGRADIRVLNMVEQMSGVANPYYYIECKILDNSIPSDAKSNLYSKYLNDGVQRYVKEKYLTHHEANGMLGFFINSADIKKNCEFFSDLKPFNFIENFDFSYKSEHKTSQKKIILYHLMLDFSTKINV